MSLKRRTRWGVKSVLLLFAILPGFPLWLIGSAILGKAVGLGDALFTPLASLFAIYYGIPARFLGSSLIPVEEFGPNPNMAGYVGAFFFYAVIAGLLSWPVWQVFKSKEPLEDA